MFMCFTKWSPVINSIYSGQLLFSNRAHPRWLVQGSQLYWAFPFSKGSLIEILEKKIVLGTVA